MTDRVVLDGARNTVPDDAVPFHAMAAADVTTTTAVPVKAAVAGKKLWITQAILTNIHATENQRIRLQDDAGTPVQFGDLSAPAAKTKVYDFNPPLETTAGTDLDAIGIIATVGDVRVTVNGYIGDA